MNVREDHGTETALRRLRSSTWEGAEHRRRLEEELMREFGNVRGRSRLRRRVAVLVAAAFVLGFAGAAVAGLAGWSVVESEDDGLTRRVVVRDPAGEAVVDERLPHGTELFLVEDEDDDGRGARSVEVR